MDHPRQNRVPAQLRAHVIDGNDYIRCYLPTAEVTEVGEQTLANGEPLGYTITLTAYPSPRGYSGKKFYSALTEGDGDDDGGR